MAYCWINFCSSGAMLEGAGDTAAVGLSSAEPLAARSP